MTLSKKTEILRYKIKLHKKVLSEDSKRFDEKTKEKIKKKCIELLSFHPEEVGEPLQFELKGYRKLKIFSDYRIVYRIVGQEVRIYRIQQRKDVYAVSPQRLLWRP